MHVRSTLVVSAVLLPFMAALAAQQAPAPQTPTPQSDPSAVVEAVEPPQGYVVGPEDVLTVMFWREPDMSAEVVVRPDGKISLPLLNDVMAAGLTPEQLRVNLVEAANRFIEDPTASVVVKEINSLKVFITGQVAEPGVYPLTSSMTVVQLIAVAGGLLEFAKTKDIVVLRQEDGRPVVHRVNYHDILRRKNLQQNIELKPGDTVAVP